MNWLKKLWVSWCPSIYCSDGVYHQKQWFECDPGAWKCSRCGTEYYTTGLFEKELEYHKMRSEIKDEDT